MPRRVSYWRRAQRALERAKRAVARWWRPSLGQRGERAAARFLRSKGYRLVARGTHIRRGELDLVAVDGRTIVFVEVKTRASLSAGHPVEAVDPPKQRRLERLALVFLNRHRLLEYPARFDVVAITWRPGQRQPEIRHIQNAFEPSAHWQMHA